MIVGALCVDPRRILFASHQIANPPNVYVLKIGYLMGQEAVELTQFGTLKECVKWMKALDTVTGKGPLLDAIADKILENEENEDECEKIGF